MKKKQFGQNQNQIFTPNRPGFAPYGYFPQNPDQLAMTPQLRPMPIGQPGMMPPPNMIQPNKIPPNMMQPGMMPPNPNMGMGMNINQNFTRPPPPRTN